MGYGNYWDGKAGVVLFWIRYWDFNCNGVQRWFGVQSKYFLLNYWCEL
jgi:hypothetical protein